MDASKTDQTRTKILEQRTYYGYVQFFLALPSYGISSSNFASSLVPPTNGAIVFHRKLIQHLEIRFLAKGKPTFVFRKNNCGITLRSISKCSFLIELFSRDGYFFCASVPFHVRSDMEVGTFRYTLVHTSPQKTCSPSQLLLNVEILSHAFKSFYHMFSRAHTGGKRDMIDL